MTCNKNQGNCKRMKEHVVKHAWGDSTIADKHKMQDMVPCACSNDSTYKHADDVLTHRRQLLNCELKSKVRTARAV